MRKLVSVVVPVYNVQNYLNRCMKCITGQTYSKLEIILVDDGSNDQSGEICEIWSEKDDRVITIHQKNGGLSAARNAGIERASGEYLIFVDSDDVIDVKMIEQLVDLIENQNAEIAICGVNHIFDETSIKFERTETAIKILDKNTAIREMWYQKSFLPSAWGKAYSRQMFGNSRFTEGILFEDIDLMHELFWKCNRIVYQDAPLYGYVHRENSITTSQFTEKDCVILNVSDKLLRFAEENNKNLLPAAQSYAVTAAFRVYLNAPRNEKKYEGFLREAVALIDEYGKNVLNDNNVRRKNRCALVMYFYCKPLLEIIYKRKNRWK